MSVMDREQWLRVGPLLEHALELSPAERDRWLSEVQTTAPELAQSLHALFAGEERADTSGFLLTPRAVPTLEGTELGAYTIERPLGHGGMGSVWLARRTDGRYEGVAAVKILNLSLLSARGHERFRREGSVLARLTHPGIARLLDAGVSPTGQPYLVLEHVDGQRIDQYVIQAALSLEAKVRLFLQVLAAVGHAHANLIVHRDLKPSNILVENDGTVKLLDFGIAKLLDADLGEDRLALTIETGRVLTPEFASPEQIQGDLITTATDVYALGVLLYLLLSGHHPTSEGSRTPEDALRAVLEVVPARLGLGDLDSVLAKALRVSPTERYQGVAALGEDLERYLNQEPVSARPDGVTYRARKFIRRHRAGVAAATITSVALIGATVLSIAQMQKARAQLDIAQKEAERSHAMSDIQSVVAGDSRGPDGRALEPAERVALAEHVLTRQFQGTPWLVAEVMVNLAGRLYDMGDRVEQRAMLARAQLIARNADAPGQLALAGCARVYSFAYDDMNDSAVQDLREAKTAIRRYRSPPDPALESVCLAAEGKLLVNLGQSDSAVALLRQAVSLYTSAKEEVPVTTLNDLGEVLRLVGRPREAIPYQRQYIAELERTGYQSTAQYPNALTFLNASLLELGELVSADSMWRAIVGRYEAQGGSARVPALVAFLYGQVLGQQGKWDSAGSWIAQAYRDEAGEASWKVTRAPSVLTQMALQRGRVAEAARQSALLPSGTRGQRAVGAWLRARIMRANGRPTEASRLLEGELRALASDGNRTLWHFALPYVTASEWRLTSGDANGADSLARLGIAAAAVDSLAMGRSAYVGRGELARARARSVLGDAAGAYDAAQRASRAMELGYGPSSAWTASARALRDSLAAARPR